MFFATAAAALKSNLISLLHRFLCDRNGVRKRFAYLNFFDV
jgi:hypothetical protein